MKFRKLLIELDVTGAQLARRLHISSAAVYKWLNGEGCPNNKKLPYIAKALNVSIERVVACFVEGM